MKFIPSRNRQQHERLWFFESIRMWRDERTDQLVVMWRRGRFLGFAIGLLLFFYFGFVAALTWWIQALAPGIPVTYAQNLNPIQWLMLPRVWSAYQQSQSDLLEKLSATLRPAVPSASTPYSPSVPSTGPSASASKLDIAAEPFSPLLAQFFAHNGGSAKLLAIHSVNIQGNVTLPAGNTLHFSLVKKMPDKVRLNIHDNLSTNESTLVTDGNTTWKWIDDPFKNGVRKALPSEAAAMLRETLYCDVAIEAVNHSGNITEPAAADAADHHFDLQLPGGMRARIFPDPDTWRPSRIEIEYEQDGKTNTNVITVEDWMTVAGFPEPAKISVTLNGQPLLDCRFESIVYNSGMYDILFQPPLSAPVAAPDAPSAASTHPPPPAPAPNPALITVPPLAPGA